MSTYGKVEGTSSKPIPQYSLNRWAREHWDACYICDFCIPHSETQVHYFKKKLVCAQCADDRTHADNMEFVERGNG